MEDIRASKSDSVFGEMGRPSVLKENFVARVEMEDWLGLHCTVPGHGPSGTMFRNCASKSVK